MYLATLHGLKKIKIKPQRAKKRTSVCHTVSCSCPIPLTMVFRTCYNEKNVCYSCILPVALLHNKIKYQLQQFKIHIKVLLLPDNIKLKNIDQQNTLQCLLHTRYTPRFWRWVPLPPKHIFCYHYHYNGYWVIHRGKVTEVWH